MKYSFGISNFLEEISRVSHSVVFLYVFALITEEGFFLFFFFNLSLLFFGTLHSDGNIIPFLICFWLLFYSQLKEEVEVSDRMWSTGEGNGEPLQYSCLENPMNSMKRQNGRTLKEELPRSVGAQYATGDQ